MVEHEIPVKKETFSKRLSTALLIALILLSTPLLAEEEQEKKNKKGKNDPEAQLAKAQALYDKGKHEKALKGFALADSLNEGKCFECKHGMFRAAVARGRFGEITLHANAVLDAAKETRGRDDDEAVIEEVNTFYHRALESSGGTDPEVIRGLIGVLARQGKSSEIVRLAQRYLDTAEKKPLLCAADYRLSMARKEALPVASEVNEQLRGLGWEGPFLISEHIRKPKLRNRSYRAGKGARMAGVIDRTGALEDFWVVRPLSEKISMATRDKIRRAHYDSATYRGRRTAVCYPFSVVLPGQVALAQKSKASTENSVSAFYTLVADFENVEAILELVEPSKTALITKRSALCAARDWHDQINQKLLEIQWPGPFFDTEAVQDPIPTRFPQPKYNNAARAAKVEGQVVLVTVVGDDGNIEHAEILKHLPEGLSEKAYNSVRTWQFEPAELEGNKVSVCRKITIEFKLDDPAAAPDTDASIPEDAGQPQTQPR